MIFHIKNDKQYMHINMSKKSLMPKFISLNISNKIEYLYLKLKLARHYVLLIFFLYFF